MPPDDLMNCLALTSDYAGSKGSPEPALRHMAAAGFRYVHWCHEWRSDYLYTAAEIRRIAAWFDEFGLALNDLHASAGTVYSWQAPDEALRAAGIDLVKNRIAMAAQLKSDVVVMHMLEPPGERERAASWARLRRALDALQPEARSRGVRIALENLPEGNQELIARALATYGPEFLGICYDAGHGNLTGDGLDWLERHRERLIALHLHDNHGATDQHLPLFAGTVDWRRLAGLITRSSYAKQAMTLESNNREMPSVDIVEFPRLMAECGRRFAALVEAARAGRK